MKQRMVEGKLRDAFRREPEHCHEALMQAARSAREEEPVKRASMRVILVTAILILAMTAVALAAVNGGLNGWFQTYYGASIPDAAVQILADTPKVEHQVGPLTFTIEETLSDGRIAYLTASVKTADGSPAILWPGMCDPNDPIGETLAEVLSHEEINAATSYAEAAQLADVPFYSVMAWLQPDADVMAGEEMMDALQRNDGSVLLVDMLYTDPEKISGVLTGKICMQAYEMNPETFENVSEERWRAEQTMEISVNGVTAEKNYKPVEDVLLGERFKVKAVKAQQTCAGVYVALMIEADEDFSFSDLTDTNFFYLLDANGERFPTGLSLTGEFLNEDGEPFPVDFDYENTQIHSMGFLSMISLDHLPDTMMIADIYGASVLVE